MRRMLGAVLSLAVSLLALCAAVAAIVSLMEEPWLSGAKPFITATAEFLAVVLSIGMAVSTGGASIRRRVAVQRVEVTGERIARVRAKIQRLQQGNPELALALDILQEEQDIQQAEANRYSFWSSVSQNFVFYVLGVVTPIVLVRLGMR